MAFALTSFFADGTRYSGPGPYRATQTYVFTITGTTDDVDLDIGDYDGTFWTDAIADATYGEMATQVVAQLERLEANYVNTVKVYTPQIDGSGALLRAAAPGAGEYTLALENFLPDYEFDTGEGLTAYTVTVELLLKPNYLPSNLAYNVQV